MPPSLPTAPAMPITRQLGSLAQATVLIAPDMPIPQLELRFRQQYDLPVAVVIAASRPLGIIERTFLFELFAQPYGRALNERKPVAEIMQAPIVLPAAMPLLDAGRHLIETVAENAELPHSLVVVENDDRYLGLVRVRELLRCITELQVQHAREANPLTGLPGNTALARHIESCLAAHRRIHVAYVDCNHFKPYNDVYGYAAGDRAIRLTGKILVDQAGTEDFVAHIGGDDFMVVFRSSDWQPRCEAVLEAFRNCIAELYPAADIERGGFHARDRAGTPGFFPLLSLAIGICHPDPLFCLSHLEVSALAADAKKEAKRIGGNVLYLTRRRRPSAWSGVEEADSVEG